MYSSNVKKYLTGAEALGSQSPIRNIIALPYTSNIEIQDGVLKARLSRLSEIAVMGAVDLWEQHPDSLLVIPGETDYEDQPNTTALMRAHILNHSSINEESIVPLDKLPNGRVLDNTYLQMEAVTNYLNGNTSGTVFVPLEFHLSRVDRVAHAYGIDNAEFVAAEDIHTELGDPQQYERYFELIAKLQRGEKLKRFAGHFDGKGRIFSQIMRVVGPNLVDIYETKAGMKLKEERAWVKEKAVKHQLAYQIDVMDY
jgi:hypothetical protein